MLGAGPSSYRREFRREENRRKEGKERKDSRKIKKLGAKGRFTGLTTSFNTCYSHPAAGNLPVNTGHGRSLTPKKTHRQGPTFGGA